MRIDETTDQLSRSLAALPPAPPHAARDQRVRARCHAALEQRRARVDRPPQPFAGAILVEAAIVGSVCLLYLSAVIEAAVRIINAG